MLVLSRRLGETIVIAEDIHVTILQASRGRVRLGISAPPDISVHRREVFERQNLSGNGNGAKALQQELAEHLAATN